MTCPAAELSTVFPARTVFYGAFSGRLSVARPRPGEGDDMGDQTNRGEGEPADGLESAASSRPGIVPVPPVKESVSGPSPTSTGNDSPVYVPAPPPRLSAPPPPPALWSGGSASSPPPSRGSASPPSPSPPIASPIASATASTASLAPPAAAELPAALQPDPPALDTQGLTAMSPVVPEPPADRSLELVPKLLIGLSALVLLAFGGLLVFGVGDSLVNTTRAPALVVGDCFEIPANEAGFNSVRNQDCALPHEAQVFAHHLPWMEDDCTEKLLTLPRFDVADMPDDATVMEIYLVDDPDGAAKCVLMSESGSLAVSLF